MAYSPELGFTPEQTALATELSVEVFALINRRSPHAAVALAALLRTTGAVAAHSKPPAVSWTQQERELAEATGYYLRAAQGCVERTGGGRMNAGHRDAESLPEAAPPGLARQLASDIRGIRVEAEGIQGVAKKAGHLHPATADMMTEIIQRLIVIGSYLRGIETVISAQKQAGELRREAPQTPQAELELVAASSTRQRMIQTLRRAGDDSLDSEEGDA